MTEKKDLSNLKTKTSIQTSFFQEIEYEKIKKIVKKLGDAPATKDSHGQDVGLSIYESSKQSARDYTINARASSAIAIMDVILAAHRDYNKQVLKHVKKMRDNHPNLTITELEKLLQQYTTAPSFKEIWGHNDKKKFETLRSLIQRILPMLKGVDNNENDFAVLSAWASQANLKDKKNDVIGSLPNIGIATFQHMRMNFGADTVKPDQRVKEIFEYEFSRKFNDRDSVLAAHEIAKICEYTPLFIDQIFVRYGSGYYRSKANIRTSVMEIIRQLKLLGVSEKIISKATGWSIDLIRNIE
ncbi:hypothetical protein ACO0K2_13045 [Undibacterium sp. MH2W]|uniref:hypothetical protein n=1 Tax=Undibacterium sp. MH2W TaxID=3413044 RepID=UPI003BF022A2